MAEAHHDAHKPQVSDEEKVTALKTLQFKLANSIFRVLTWFASGINKKINYGRRSLDNLMATFLVFFLIMTIDHPLINSIGNNMLFFGEYLPLDSYSLLFRICFISLMSTMLYLICLWYIRQIWLRILLFYKGWLYQPAKSRSVMVMLWALLVRLVSYRKPMLYCHQGSIPRMSVPPLKVTMTKLLESLKPLVAKEEYKNMETNASEFLSTIGPKLQRLLYLKSWLSPNYYSDWWEKYAYLMSRNPIAINSNYYYCDQLNFVPTERQISRAAGVTSIILQFKCLMDTEELEPVVLGGIVPVCNWQYKRLFSTARVPNTDVDTIRHHPGSEHIAVYAKGHFYKVNVNNAHGNPLNLLDFEILFDWILKDVETWPATSDAESRIASLTSNDRTTWAKCRLEHFMAGVNRDSLSAIEEAIFMVVLDDNELPNIDQRAKYLLHGNGASLWFDKSFCPVFFTDGKMGINGEHSWADASITAHLMEYIFTQEYLYRMYDYDGFCKPYISPSSTSSLVLSKAVITPTRLYWDMNFALEKVINKSYLFAVKNNSDLDICVKVHDLFGKGVMKKARINPDAFMQIAFQLAYHKDSGGLFANTYEASVLRLYLRGRTEATRSFTQEVKEFVLAMNDSEVTSTEKMQLMRMASERHQKLSRDSMSGKGIDRHLFALYVVSKAKGYDNQFLGNVLAMPWTLSTSQGPLFQMKQGLDPNNKRVRDAFTQGGGFGPVTHNGYGVCYFLPSDTTLYFHVSCKKSCPTTDPKRFMDNIFWALSKMKSMLDESKKL